MWYIRENSRYFIFRKNHDPLISNEPVEASYVLASPSSQWEKLIVNLIPSNDANVLTFCQSLSPFSVLKFVTQAMHQNILSFARFAIKNHFS